MHREEGALSLIHIKFLVQNIVLTPRRLLSLPQSVSEARARIRSSAYARPPTTVSISWLSPHVPSFPPAPWLSRPAARPPRPRPSLAFVLALRANNDGIEETSESTHHRQRGQSTQRRGQRAPLGLDSGRTRGERVFLFVLSNLNVTASISYIHQFPRAREEALFD